MNYWPFQIRAAQGHARQIVDERALYRSALVIYASERSADVHHAAFAGKPVITDPEEWPKAVFHRTYAAAWQNIAQTGLKIAGGNMDPRAKAHLYTSEYQVDGDRYQAGQRRQCPIELEIDIVGALHGGFVAFRTRAGAILSCMDLPREYIISAGDTYQKAVLWHCTLKETEAERISQEYATDNPEQEHPPEALPHDGRKLCPECSSEQVAGTAQCQVCGFLFDVEPH